MLPVYPTASLPSDCPFGISLPTRPTGAVITLSADASSFTVRQSNVTIDLNGFKIGRLVFADGVSVVRISNGRLGTMRTNLQRSSDAPTLVNNVTIDNVIFDGGVTTLDGNSLRVGSLLLSNCSSVAATSSASLNGIHTCVLWLDPGSHDVLVQDCDFWTRGHEACLRFVSSKRTIVTRSKLGVSSEKHCYRVHGNVGPAVVPAEDHYIGDCELRNRGMMVATLPDSIGPQRDMVTRMYAKRIKITMKLDGRPGSDDPFQYSPRTFSGANYLQTAVADGIDITAGRNPMPALEQIAQNEPLKNWIIVNSTFTKI